MSKDMHVISISSKVVAGMDGYRLALPLAPKGQLPHFFKNNATQTILT